MLKQCAGLSCSSSLSGLSGFSVERNQPDEPNQLNKQNKPDLQPNMRVSEAHLQFHMTQAKGIGDHGHRTEGHGGAGNHGTQ